MHISLFSARQMGTLQRNELQTNEDRNCHSLITISLKFLCDTNLKHKSVLSRRIDVPYDVRVLHCAPAVRSLGGRRFDIRI
jgi:hypothetical protein